MSNQPDAPQQDPDETGRGARRPPARLPAGLEGIAEEIAEEVVEVVAVVREAFDRAASQMLPPELRGVSPRPSDAPDRQPEPAPKPRRRVRVPRPVDQDARRRTRDPILDESPPGRDDIPIGATEQVTGEELSQPTIEIFHDSIDAARRPARPARAARTARTTRRHRPDVPTASKQDDGVPSGETAQRTEPPSGPARRPILETSRPELHRTVESGTDASADTARLQDTSARVAGSVEPFVIEPSTFGSAPWWSRGWWRIVPGGSARDIICDAGTVGPVAAAAISLRGHKHRLDAAPNDDAFSMCTGSAADGTEWLIGCVCDGVGSAPRASEGSASAATTFAHSLADLCGRPEWNDGRPDEETLAATVDEVRARIAEQLSIDRTAFDAFETTLTFVAVPTSRSGDEPRRALFGWTGDSPALILRDGVWTDPTGALTEDGVGPSSTQTAGFLTSARLEGVVSVELEADDVILLCSDGVSAFVTDGTRNRQYGVTLASVIARPVDVLHLVNLFAFDMRSADDDRTALIVWQDVGPGAAQS